MPSTSIPPPASRIRSPTRNGRALSSTIPAIRLPSVCCAARPTMTAVNAPPMASSRGSRPAMRRATSSVTPTVARRMMKPNVPAVLGSMRLKRLGPIARPTSRAIAHPRTTRATTVPILHLGSRWARRRRRGRCRAAGRPRAAVRRTGAASARVARRARSAAWRAPPPPRSGSWSRTCRASGPTCRESGWASHGERAASSSTTSRFADGFTPQRLMQAPIRTIRTAPPASAPRRRGRARPLAAPAG